MSNKWLKELMEMKHRAKILDRKALQFPVDSGGVSSSTSGCEFLYLAGICIGF